MDELVGLGVPHLRSRDMEPGAITTYRQQAGCGDDLVLGGEPHCGLGQAECGEHSGLLEQRIEIDQLLIDSVTSIETSPSAPQQPDDDRSDSQQASSEHRARTKVGWGRGRW